MTMINDDDDRWICLSDLFAGLMAFFIFVSVGAMTENASLGDMFLHGFGKNIPDTTGDNATRGEPEEGRETKGGSIYKGINDHIGTKINEHVYVYGDTISLGKAFFDDDQIGLSKHLMNELNAGVTELDNKLKAEPLKNKVIFSGYASCKCKRNTRRYLEGILDSIPDETGTLEQIASKNAHINAFIYNYALSEERAYAMYIYFLKKSEVLKESSRDITIRYKGESDSLAAYAQKDVKCQERDKNSEMEKHYRAVQVTVYEDFPIGHLEQADRILKSNANIDREKKHAQ